MVIFSLGEAFVAPFDTAWNRCYNRDLLLFFLNQTKGQQRVFERYLNGKMGPRRTQPSARVLSDGPQTKEHQTQLSHRAHGSVLWRGLLPGVCSGVNFYNLWQNKCHSRIESNWVARAHRQLQRIDTTQNTNKRASIRKQLRGVRAHYWNTGQKSMNTNLA